MCALHIRWIMFTCVSLQTTTEGKKLHIKVRMFCVGKTCYVYILVCTLGKGRYH